MLQHNTSQQGVEIKCILVCSSVIYCPYPAVYYVFHIDDGDGNDDGGGDGDGDDGGGGDGDDDDDSDGGDDDEGGILPQTSCQGGERQDQRLSDQQTRHPSSVISLSLIFHTLYFSICLNTSRFTLTYI